MGIQLESDKVQENNKLSYLYKKCVLLGMEYIISSCIFALEFLSSLHPISNIHTICNSRNPTDHYCIEVSLQLQESEMTSTLEGGWPAMGSISYCNKPTSLELQQFALHHMAETEMATHNSSKVRISIRDKRPWGT